MDYRGLSRKVYALRPAHSIESGAMRFDVPADFDFHATVLSHGWCVLAPFVWDAEAGALERPIRLSGRRTARVRLSQPGGRGRPVEGRVVGGAGSRAALPAADARRVGDAVGRMLRLGEDLDAFYARCRAAGAPFAQVPADAFGRLLRSPTAFEDLVKILATTNTSWSGTKAMVANLVALTGPGGAFPTPAEVAAFGAPRLRSEARWGYRAEPLARLAEAVATGTLDLAAWETWAGPTEALEAEILALPGFGPYAAAQALALLGRYDRIGVDTVFRAFVRRRHFARARRPPSDARMVAVYDGWGEWRGLAYWYDMWSHDFEDAEGL